MSMKFNSSISRARVDWFLIVMLDAFVPYPQTAQRKEQDDSEKMNGNRIEFE